MGPIINYHNQEQNKRQGEIYDTTKQLAHTRQQLNLVGQIVEEATIERACITDKLETELDCKGAIEDAGRNLQQ